MSLIAHLCDLTWAVFGRLHEQLGFVECSGKRFFHIDVFPFGEREHTYGEVGEVGCGDGYSVKSIAGFVKHLTEILEPFCVRIHRQDFLCMFCSEIHVAECDHIDHACFSEVVYDLFAAVAYSDIGYLYLTALR